MMCQPCCNAGDLLKGLAGHMVGKLSALAFHAQCAHRSTCTCQHSVESVLR